MWATIKLQIPMSKMLKMSKISWSRVHARDKGIEIQTVIKYEHSASQMIEQNALTLTPRP